jgi:type I restriction enzyme S subunit
MRLRGIVSEWKSLQIKQLGEIVTGKTPSVDHPDDWGNEMPFVTPSDYKFYRKNIHSSIRNLSVYGKERLDKKILPPQSVLVTCIGSDMGKVVMNSVPVITNQQINSIIPYKDLMDCDFLYYSLVSMYDIIRIYGGDGTAVPIVNKGDFGKIEVDFPHLHEQKAIASVLSSLDDKIDLLHRQNKTLEVMAETLFRQWFIEEAQDDWPIVKVGDFVSMNMSILTKSNNIRWIKYLDTGSLTEGRIQEYQDVDIEDAPSRAKRIVKHNDILISTVRPNHKHYGIMRNPENNLIVSTGFCVISCDKICPYFLYIFLTTGDMTEYLHSIAEGSTSTYPSLKPSDIEALEFKLPPKQELYQFSEYAENACGKIDNNYKQIRTIEKLRDNLLPKLMSGEVRVNCE